MAGLSISKAWEDSKARLAADGKLMVAVALALIMLPQAVVVLAAPPAALSGAEPGGESSALMLAATILALVGQLAIARLAIGPATSVGDSIAHGFKRLLPLIGAVLILALVVILIAIPLTMLLVGVDGLEAAAAGGTATSGLGLTVLLLVIIALLVGARFLLLVPVATAEPGGPIHILKRCSALVSGHYIKLIGFVLLLLILLMIITLAIQLGGGSLIQLFLDIKPFSVGALLYGLLVSALQAAIAVPFSVLVSQIYLQLAGGGDSETVSVPSSGT
ncbi:hypothetical protein H8M03_00330 [Sphingomonas sabuli]|uniref:Glycerophosphoryl diester phosphodiesterase membrane domain-containing protein n=1 Tax=Sphingomonas sabuli TaxID=2764186 RepID=A0A7G9L2L0_9SPHN|nr:hypothetical protein [Sphingomonas sabuli]QNM82859.1 hypothetical protein H8M03_00330 [Sphingomonas sabuli]